MGLDPKGKATTMEEGLLWWRENVLSPLLRDQEVIRKISKDPKKQLSPLLPA
jgi:hypothetical protein